MWGVGSFITCLNCITTEYVIVKQCSVVGSIISPVTCFRLVLPGCVPGSLTVGRETNLFTAIST